MSTIDQIIQQSQQKVNAVLPSAVLSNLILWTGVSFGTVIAFNVLRPRNKIVYEPKVKYFVDDKQPPKIKDGFFSWVSPLIHTKEPELVDKVGLDAVTFLRFTRMMRWLFLCVALLTCVVLIPVNVVYNLRSVSSDQRDVLSMLTLRDVKNDLLFVHVAASYLIGGFVMYFSWTNWKDMVRLRQAWFRSDEYDKNFYARTLMVTKVPKKLQSDEGIQSLFQSLQVPYPTTAVHIGRRVGQLPELIKYYNDTVCELERVLVRYLKGGKIGTKRPTIRIGGSMGCGGEKRDAIEHYTNKLKAAENAIEDWRGKIELGKVEPYGFASMASVPYAHIVAQLTRGKSIKGARIDLAPNPKDIIWENLNQSEAVRRQKQTIGWVYIFVVAFFNTIPLLFISFLANLTAISDYIKPLNSWALKSPFTFSLVSGVLPPSVAGLFGYLLPIIMRWITKYQGATTNSRLDQAVVARYYAFLIISQLVIFSLIGVGFNSAKQVVLQVGQHLSFIQILKNLNKLGDTIPQTYIDQANYWLTYFPLRGFLVVFDLAQLVNLLWTSFKTHLFGRTPRDIRNWTQPPDFEYAIYYSNLLFMAAVGLIFAPLAPLVAVSAAVVFWMSAVVYKYQLMFVFITHVESGGRLWNVIINRLLYAVVFMQLLLILTIGLQLGFDHWLWISAVPLIPIIAAFKFYVTRTFEPEFRFYKPTQADIAHSRMHGDNTDSRTNKLEKRFGHPAMHAELFTPLLHAYMTPLLSQVYQGRLAHQKTALDEYGGQKLDTSVTPEGIKIAAVEQRDLEYDPVLYQRDRGEASDWDTQSTVSGMSKPGGDVKPAGYMAYMARGPVPTGVSSDDFHGPTESRTDLVPLLPGGMQAAQPMRRDWSSTTSASTMDTSAPPYQQFARPGMYDRPPSADQLSGYGAQRPPQGGQQPYQGQDRSPQRMRGASGSTDSLGAYGGYGAQRPPQASQPPYQGQNRPPQHMHGTSGSIDSLGAYGGGRSSTLNVDPRTQHHQSVSVYSEGGGGGGSRPGSRNELGYSIYDAYDASRDPSPRPPSRDELGYGRSGSPAQYRSGSPARYPTPPAAYPPTQPPPQARYPPMQDQGQTRQAPTHRGYGGDGSGGGAYPTSGVYPYRI